MPNSSSEQQVPANPWGAPVPIDAAASTAERHARALDTLPGVWVAMPVRFGGQSSRLHNITLKFGAVEHDGTVPGHLVAQTPRGPAAARRAVVWDPLMETFRLDDRSEVDWLFRQLDPISAICGSFSQGVMDKTGSVMGVIGALLVPRFFVVGGVGAILFAYAVYYYLWFFMLEFVLVYVLLPGVALAFGAALLREWRWRPLENALFQAAWHAYDPEAYHAPR